MDICALIISILAFLLSVFQFFRDSSRQKNEATLIAYNELQNDVFSNLVQYSLDNMPDIKYGDEKWTQFTIYLAKLERFSVGVNTGIYSIDILNHLGGAYYIRQFEKLKPIIDEKRNANRVNGSHYDEFEKTVNRLKKYRSTNCFFKKFVMHIFWAIKN